MAACLLVVECEMLHAHGDTVFLNLLNVRNSHLSGKIRVFTHVFEVAAAKRGTIDVHARSEKHVLFTVARLLSDGFSIKGRHLLRPRSRKACKRGICGT